MELITRFGDPTARSHHVVFAQGKLIEMGPILNFRKADWNISCDLVDGRCMRISHSKPGDWSEDQIQFVLAANSQGVKWD